MRVVVLFLFLMLYCQGVLATTVGANTNKINLGSNHSSSIDSSSVNSSSVNSSFVNKACNKISNKLASVSYTECQDLVLKIAAESENKFPLLIKEFPPLKLKKPLGKILLIGGIHGDEYSSVSVTFKWLKILKKHHSGLFHWKIAPLVNPDGLLQKQSQRINSNKVDLNRNFPSNDAAQKHLEFWQEHAFANERKYPGKKPLSEKESQWIARLIKEFKPDVIVSVHAPFGLVDFDKQAENISTKAPTHLGPLHLHLLGTYPGSLGRYGSEVMNIPVITVELEYAGIMPSNKDISHIWVDLVAWLKNYFKTEALNSK